MDQEPSLKQLVVDLIRSHDIEMAEGFQSRCPQDMDQTALTDFFHMTLMSHVDDRCDLARARLRATDTQDMWFENLHAYVVPLLVELRWPPNTRKEATTIYDNKS